MSSSFPTPEKLREIAENDPDGLEQIRRQEIEQLIARAPEHLKARLRGLQFQIDCKRQLHKNPLGACIEISRMMFDSVATLSQALHGNSNLYRSNYFKAAEIFVFPSTGKNSNVQQR